MNRTEAEATIAAHPGENGAKSPVQWITVGENGIDQRLDNFLITRLKGVPKSMIYRIVRKGEVRVNKGRVEGSYRLLEGDLIRIPPLRMAEAHEPTPVSAKVKHSLDKAVLFEDDAILVLNKPAGLAVHGGSGIESGLIESLRQLRPQAKFLELAHRLDKDTSGCLIVAKKRSALRKLHEIFRDDKVNKQYIALLAGRWEKKKLLVEAPLQKNTLSNGECMVVVNKQGKSAQTLFRRLQSYRDCTLVSAAPKTGRTHQIRVHAAWLRHPIIADERYGDFELNREFKKRGYKRLFLHAEKLEFEHPLSGELQTVVAPLPSALQTLLDHEQKL